MAWRKERIERVEARAYTIPTDAPEADGTFAWKETTIIVVEATGGGKTGLGYTYSHKSVAGLITSVLADAVRGTDPLDVPAAHGALVGKVRNIGSRGLAANAISAVDTALWDLKARLLDLPLCKLFGQARESVPVYGSGGFTTYDDDRLREQLGGWASEGCRWVKMKVGSEPERDLHRARVAKEAIGDTELFVDANGAYGRKQALWFAQAYYDELGVTCFEEPVSSDDLDGLRLLRDRAPAGMRIAAGEYGYDPFYFKRMLAAGRSTCSRPTPPAAAASPASSRWPACATRTRCRSRPTPRPRCTCTCAAPRRALAPRVVPRPCADRADAVRRGPSRRGRCDPPRPLASGPRARAQAPGRGALRGLSGRGDTAWTTTGRPTRRAGPASRRAGRPAPRAASAPRSAPRAASGSRSATAS